MTRERYASRVRTRTLDIVHERGPITTQGIIIALAAERMFAGEETVERWLMTSRDKGEIAVACFEEPGSTITRHGWKTAPPPAVLRWDKPPRERPPVEHYAMYGGDDCPPGAYVPNMTKGWQRAWKAKMAGQRSENLVDLRVEIRKSVTGAGYDHAQVLIVVLQSGAVRVSMNGTAHFTPAEWDEFGRAVTEARQAISDYQEDHDGQG